MREKLQDLIIIYCIFMIDLFKYIIECSDHMSGNVLTETN